MDQDLDYLPIGDVLIEGRQIVKIALSVNVSDAQVIDTRSAIVILFPWHAPQHLSRLCRYDVYVGNYLGSRHPCRRFGAASLPFSTFRTATIRLSTPMLR
jgi:hypothetical protein